MIRFRHYITINNFSLPYLREILFLLLLVHCKEHFTLHSILHCTVPFWTLYCTPNCTLKCIKMSYWLVYYLWKTTLPALDMEKDKLFTQARFDPTLIYTKKCVNLDKGDFATKHRKMYLITSISKTRLPHIYRGQNYIFNLICSLLKIKFKI